MGKFNHIYTFFYNRGSSATGDKLKKIAENAANDANDVIQEDVDQKKDELAQKKADQDAKDAAEAAERQEKLNQGIDNAAGKLDDLAAKLRQQKQ